MRPEQLSHELREARSTNLNRRRWIMGLSMVGAAASQLVTLYQMGVIPNLPDPPVPVFDSSRVDASNYAYENFNMPDGPRMLITYGITAALTATGGKNRAEEMPLLPIATAVKTAIDAGQATVLAFKEWDENQALCAYCQAATLASVASVALALPEAMEAIRHLRNRRTRQRVFG